MSQTLREQLIAEVAKHARVDPATVQPMANLVVELGLSSMDLLTVLAFAEETFGARFPDEVLGELYTIERIEEAVAAHQVATGPAIGTEGQQA